MSSGRPTTRHTTLCIRLQPDVCLIHHRSVPVQHVWFLSSSLSSLSSVLHLSLRPPGSYLPPFGLHVHIIAASSSSSSSSPLQLHTDRHTAAGSVSAPPADPLNTHTHTASSLCFPSNNTAASHLLRPRLLLPPTDKYFSLN